MSDKDSVLSVRLPSELADKLHKCSERLDLSKNDIARHAIRAAVEAVEANGYRIELPLEMAVKKGPLESRPRGVAGAMMILKNSGTGSTPSLNEDPPRAHTPGSSTPGPKNVRRVSRAALRKGSKPTADEHSS